jgi:hypothetical protein
MTANDADEWVSYTSATTVRWGMAVYASITWNAGENYVTPTTASTQRALGVAMVEASPRGKPCPVAHSGIVLVKCQSVTGTMGHPAVACATSGEIRSAGALTVVAATANSRQVGLFAENFTGNTAGDKVKVLLRPGRR